MGRRKKAVKYREERQAAVFAYTVRYNLAKKKEGRRGASAFLL